MRGAVPVPILVTPRPIPGRLRRPSCSRPFSWHPVCLSNMWNRFLCPDWTWFPKIPKTTTRARERANSELIPRAAPMTLKTRL
ncbi:hypothetical protein M427DRAFT_51275, partial [Gonapodya prolifera JEL478]